MGCMNTPKTLDSTALPSVTVTRMPTDAPDSERKPLGTPTADLLKALEGVEWGFTYKELCDFLYGEDEDDSDLNE